MPSDGAGAAALMREVQLLAWSTERHAASEAVLLQPMPDVLRNFIF
jgi:hypothetical protein